METLLETLIGLAILVGLGAIAREAEQSAESEPVLVPIPVKERRRLR
ncbi:hypothetical protein [Pseudanabaena sp. FACHB-2040]|nr:hypothetical protein [Pseudanabaena sp. FACHB-2040]MBD0267006.1 hypothetical protein [Cyanobacteria bacterium Co-bin8]MBD2257766.1 hypothetical protein [Pseudanabaena sp. FACHB-2040]